MVWCVGGVCSTYTSVCVCSTYTSVCVCSTYTSLCMQHLFVMHPTHGVSGIPFAEPKADPGPMVRPTSAGGASYSYSPTRTPRTAGTSGSGWRSTTSGMYSPPPLAVTALDMQRVVAATAAAELVERQRDGGEDGAGAPGPEMVEVPSVAAEVGMAAQAVATLAAPTTPGTPASTQSRSWRPPTGSGPRTTGWIEEGEWSGGRGWHPV